MIALSWPELRAEFTHLGYPWFGSPLSLNLFGIRAANPRAGCFDDTIGLAWIDLDGHQQLLQFPATTDPGAYYLTHPLNSSGTAILAPGHYPAMYRPGLHRGRYRALVQAGPCTVIRDRNRDDRLDFTGRRQTGWFGINLHRAAARGTTLTVGPHSAGCQVVQRAADLSAILALVDLQAKHLGTPQVSYTLFYEPELVSGRAS